MEGLEYREEEARHTFEQKLEAIGIPVRYRQAALSDLPAMDLIPRFLNKEFYGLFMSGVNGCGKTHAGCAILIYLAKQGIQCYRSTVVELIQDYVDNGWKVPRRYLQPPFLFLDEVGKELKVKTDLATPVLEQVLKYRAENAKSTILAANASLEELGKLYGPTLVSLVIGDYRKFTGLSPVDRRQV